MDELRAAREQSENISRKLNQDLEDRCTELQDAHNQVASLEARLQEARIQEQESINRHLDNFCPHSISTSNVHMSVSLTNEKYLNNIFLCVNLLSGFNSHCLTKKRRSSSYRRSCKTVAAPLTINNSGSKNLNKTKRFIFFIFSSIL